MRRFRFVRRSVQIVVLTVLALILATAATFAAPSAATTTTDHYVVDGSRAVASWFLNLPNGCGNTYVGVLPINGVTLAGGPPSSGSFLLVSYSVWDICHFNFFYGSTFTTIPAGAFTVTGPNPYLGATLAPVTVYVPGNNPRSGVSLTISMNWSSSTAPTRYRDMTSTMSAGTRMQENYFGDFAPATATGTIILNSVNLTPTAANIATISQKVSGNLTVTH